MAKSRGLPAIIVLMNMRGGLPKFAAKNRDQGTPKENKAVVQGSIAYFGTYTVSESDKVISAKIEGSTYPNFVEGPGQKRLITSVTADELKFINPAASAGEKAPTGLEASEVSV